jgi:hypothetical protein
MSKTAAGSGGMSSTNDGAVASARSTANAVAHSFLFGPGVQSNDFVLEPVLGGVHHPQRWQTRSRRVLLEEAITSKMRQAGGGNTTRRANGHAAKLSNASSAGNGSWLVCGVTVQPASAAVHAPTITDGRTKPGSAKSTVILRHLKCVLRSHRLRDVEGDTNRTNRAGGGSINETRSLGASARDARPNNASIVRNGLFLVLITQRCASVVHHAVLRRVGKLMRSGKSSRMGTYSFTAPTILRRQRGVTSSSIVSSCKRNSVGRSHRLNRCTTSTATSRTTARRISSCDSGSTATGLPIAAPTVVLRTSCRWSSPSEVCVRL